MSHLLKSEALNPPHFLMMVDSWHLCTEGSINVELTFLSSLKPKNLVRLHLRLFLLFCFKLLCFLKIPSFDENLIFFACLCCE